MRYSWESVRGASGNRWSAEESGNLTVNPTPKDVVHVSRSDYLRVS